MSRKKHVPTVQTSQICIQTRSSEPAPRFAARHQTSLIRSTVRWNRNLIFDTSLFIAKYDDIFVRPSLGQFTEQARLIVFRLSHQNNQNDAIFVCDANLTDVAGDSSLLVCCLISSLLSFFFNIFVFDFIDVT